LLEAGKNADGQTGETGGQVSVCKETFLIRPPAREKSNYLSVNMKQLVKIALFMFMMVSLANSDEKKYGIGLAGTISYMPNDNVWFPVFTLSDYFINRIGYHDISIEYMGIDKNTNEEKLSIQEGSFSYAFLFKLPIQVITIGPTLGLWYFGYDKQNLTYWTADFETDTYFGGGKIAVILGKKNFRMVIKQLILLGTRLTNGATQFSIQPITQLGLLYAF
jgi:hypothetical protein